MKKMIGVAVLLGLLAAGITTTSFAQPPCGTGQIIDWDANGFTWETPANPVGNVSPAGNSLNMVALVNLFCAPFADLDPNDPGTEYTIVFSGLSNALATAVIPAGSTTVWNTNYGSGTFVIYAGTPRNAPSYLAMPPPGGIVPANYADGTAILSGTVANFRVQITKTGTNPANGSFRSDYTFTGGTLYSRVAGTGVGLLHGLWNLSGAPAGYSAHPDGKFDNPPTAVRPSTWGAIKQLYK
jgi:hypothetical protein